MAFMKKTLLPLGFVLLLLLGTQATLVGCGKSPAEVGGLSYTVEPGEGSLTTTIDDDRPGEHTVWIVVNKTDGTHVWTVQALNTGTTDSAGSVSATGDIAAGTYVYRVLEVEDLIDDASAWLGIDSRHEIARGEVRVR